MRLALHITFLLLFAQMLGAQTPSLEENWESITKDIDYTENFRESKPDTTKKTEQNKSIIRPKHEFKNPSLFKNSVLVIIGIALLVLIILLINSALNAKTPVKIKTSVLIEETDDPDVFQVSDLEKHLQEAVADENYRLAVRIRFLMLIKLLKDNNHIEWKNEKTNSDYCHEVSKHSYKQNFKYLINVFEKVWYANYKVDKAAYDFLAGKYSLIHQQIERG